MVGAQAVCTSQEGNLKKEHPLAEQQNAAGGTESRAGLSRSWGLWQRLWDIPPITGSPLVVQDELPLEVFLCFAG